MFENVHSLMYEVVTSCFAQTHVCIAGLSPRILEIKILAYFCAGSLDINARMSRHKCTNHDRSESDFIAASLSDVNQRKNL